ncbi:hypothetical protein [Fusibacter sp. 3D3]|uniref:hypothetical protein n=1 Tax=Fusibacter sp. 3D3 TaxID=1048380 RepID=UPI001585F0F3|nr:hypothetical protein [Fusibacter sp. 3D3]
MKEIRNPDVTITKMSPLIIEDEHYTKAFGIITLEQGGYIEILVDCSFTIDELVKVDGEASKSPDIIVKGIDGNVGKHGENGEEGKLGAICEIVIENLKSDLNVHVYGGGEGGLGGLGGDGGKGGDGSYGANGGNGGDGQEGTFGGNGGSGGVLTITYKTENESQVIGKELCSLGGEAGIAGRGGAGGSGKCNGHNGKEGRKGIRGDVGGRGTLIIKE